MRPDIHASAATRDGTSNPEFTLQFRIPPPAEVRPGVKFTLPVIVATCPSPGRHPLEYDQGQQLMLYVSLRDESIHDAATADSLAGELSDSLHSRDDDAMKGFSKFENLVIHRPGRFRIRVSLGITGASSEPGLVKNAYVDSHVIRVDPSADIVQRPTPEQVSILHELTVQNLHISEGDIAYWREL